MKKLNAFLLSFLYLPNSFGIGVNLDEAKTIKADKIKYNIKSEELQTSGNTEMTNASGQKIKLKEASLVKLNSNVAAKDIELWLGSNVYIKAKEINKNNQITTADRAMFTACDGCDSFGHAWEITGNEIIHDENEKMIYFHNAAFWLYNGNIPIFWLPYYDMPDPSVKYKSGLLTPSFKSTSDMGTQLNIPVYINISDKHDLTTTFSYLTDENPLFQLEHRLNATHSEFRTKGSFTHNKAGENRWHIFNDDIIEMGENTRALIYIQRTSDKTYLQKYGFYNYQPYLDSGAKLEIFGQSSYVIADTHIFQELREPQGNQTISSGNILPNIFGKYQSDPFFKETYVVFSGDLLGVSSSKQSSQRIIGEGRIVSPWTLWGGNRLTASIATRYDIYNFENTKIYENNTINNSYSGMKSRFLPSGYIEWGLPLYDIKNDWTYTLEPQARLTIMEHTNKNNVFAVNNDSAGRFLSDTTLFSDNRYSGFDVWENGNFIDYGAQWSAFDNKNDISVFFGQTYDFNTQDDNDFNDNGFRNGFSDYVGRVSYNRDLINLSTRFRIDKNDISLNHIENSAYIGRNNTYFSLGHIWDSNPLISNKDTHEGIVSAGLQLTKRINVRGYVFYNMYEHLFQRHSAGIFYEHPCFYLSFEYRRDNAIKEDYRGGTTFQFKFGMSIDGKHY
ncbi:MAG: LPS-assembly protein LptD [Alphaproteobacteria bacterium]|nr:LPS-assembly protein LptD [Alphaproteobacteria bacterium]